MKDMDRRKEVRLSNHTVKRLADRGVRRDELENALRVSGKVIKEDKVYRIEKPIDDESTLVLYVKDKGSFNLIITYWIQTCP